jgi:hypothetical protein
MSTMTKEPLVQFKSNQIDYQTVNGLLSQLWQHLNSKIPIGITKKVYSVATECLENIYKYADTDGTESLSFSIWSDDEYIYIDAENILKHVKIAKLEYNIDLVNSLDKIELKKLFKHKIQTRKISELGGAGLGLIIIARKIDGKISYKIKDVNSHYASFSFSAKISILNTEENF